VRCGEGQARQPFEGARPAGMEQLRVENGHSVLPGDAGGVEVADGVVGVPTRRDVTVKAAAPRN
jgi:hypothetical protein